MPNRKGGFVKSHTRTVKTKTSGTKTVHVNAKLREGCSVKPKKKSH